MPPLGKEIPTDTHGSMCLSCVTSVSRLTRLERAGREIARIVVLSFSTQLFAVYELSVRAVD